MQGLLYGQVFGQLGFVAALAAAPFLAPDPGAVALGVGLWQLSRLLPLGLSRRPLAAKRVLIGVHLLAGMGLFLALVLRSVPLAYLAAGGAGVVEGWLMPVLNARLFDGPRAARANALYVASSTGLPLLVWPFFGALVERAGPVGLLGVAGVFFFLRALSLIRMPSLLLPPAAAGTRGLFPVLLAMALMILPLGFFSAFLPGRLGPLGYAIYSELFGLGTVLGALLAARWADGFTLGGLALALGLLGYGVGAFGLGGLLYGLGLGALQVAGLGWLGRRHAGAFSGVLAALAAASALGGVLGALLAALGNPIVALLLSLFGLILGGFSLRWERRP